MALLFASIHSVIISFALNSFSCILIMVCWKYAALEIGGIRWKLMALNIFYFNFVCKWVS